MKIYGLKQQLLFRQVLKKNTNNPRYTEMEANTLIAILIINSKAQPCSPRALSEYLSKLSRTPSRKKLYGMIKRFKNDGMIRQFSNRTSSQLYLTLAGKQYLLDLDRQLKRLGRVESSMII